MPQGRVVGGKLGGWLADTSARSPLIWPLFVVCVSFVEQRKKF